MSRKSAKRWTYSAEITDADRALVKRLARHLDGQTTARVLDAIYKDGEVVQRLARRVSAEAEHVAYLSGIVIAEVALARLNRTAAA